MQGKTIIVTGGCGYIGSHIARAFAYENPSNRVHVIDRVFREHTVKGSIGYMIEDFASDAALAFIINMAPDIIVHCAGTSLVGPSILDPGDYYDNNVAKTIRLLNVAKDLPKLPIIMFSSSASVYGNPKEFPITENSKLQPISPYGRSKAIIETILRDYVIGYSLRSICFRYFNAAGAEPFNFDLGQEPNATHIVAKSLEASLTGRGFTINGDSFPTPDGTCIRDYVHVWDIAMAHVQGARFLLDDFIPLRGAYILNLGTNNGISNKEIVDYVNKQHGLKFVKYGPSREGDPAKLIANASLAKELINWTPKYSDINSIIDSAYKWYNSRS